MSGEIRPPTVGDVLWAAKAYGYPPLEGAGVAIATGEASWRASVTDATAPEVWEALRAADLNEGDAADAADANAREEDDDEDGDG